MTIFIVARTELTDLKTLSSGYLDKAHSAKSSRRMTAPRALGVLSRSSAPCRNIEMPRGSNYESSPRLLKMTGTTGTNAYTCDNALIIEITSASSRICMARASSISSKSTTLRLSQARTSNYLLGSSSPVSLVSLSRNLLVL